MAEPPFLRNYEDWKHCITVLCGIPLTADYVERRIAALDDVGDHTTQRFIQAWGEEHLRRVRAWFRQAREELAARGEGVPE